jgi:translation initiation factor IF-2
MVLEGTILRTAKARLLRDNVLIWEGSLSSLKRFKDDASEVKNGFECGIGLEKYHDIKLGDIIEAYRTVEVLREA